MSQTTEVGNQKLPFASYDTVVYFGGGTSLFTILYIYFPLNLEVLPKNPTTFGEYGIFFLLAIGCVFLVYAIGHALAFASSTLVEGLAHRTYGYPSLIYEHVVNSRSTPPRQSARRYFFQNTWGGFSKGAWVTSVIRFVFGLPIFIASLVTARVNFVGYFLPKIPEGATKLYADKLVDRDLHKYIDPFTQNWFKIIEHYVIANVPDTWRRMYNYMMIYGLLRSSTLLLLVAFWLEVNQIIVTKFDFYIFPTPSYIGIRPRDGMFGTLIFLAVCASTTYFCFVKFSRRYFEEALLGFSLKEA